MDTTPAPPAAPEPAPPQGQLWPRVARHRLALAGLGVLAALAALALVGPLALPDDSPGANRQLPALARLPAGSTLTFLRLPYPEPPAAEGLWARWWQGQPPPTRELPLSVNGAAYTLRLTADSVWAEPAAAVRGLPLAAARPMGWGPEQLVGTRRFPLGTDALGRCLYSRLALGARVTLSIGLLAVVASLAIGTMVGLVAGYFGGWLDRVLQGLMTVVWALPALLLALTLAFVLGKGFAQLVWAVALSLWVDVARIVRGEVRSLKERGYIEAARIMGFGHGRILAVHLLPALTGPLVILAAANFASAILLESGLSFLGLGVAPPTPSWGAMVQEGYPYLLIDRGRGIALWPAAALFVSILSLYLVGQGLRDALDPRQQ